MEELDLSAMKRFFLEQGERRILEKQDYFVRLNWQDEVLFPHEAASNNICYLNQAVQALEEGEIEEALKALYEVDNNCYAFLFDEEVYYHFTEYILHQPKDRLM